MGAACEAVWKRCTAMYFIDTASGITESFFGSKACIYAYKFLADQLVAINVRNRLLCSLSY